MVGLPSCGAWPDRNSVSLIQLATYTWDAWYEFAELRLRFTYGFSGEMVGHPVMEIDADQMPLRGQQNEASRKLEDVSAFRKLACALRLRCS